ncbi:MAG TPA: NlpC/P60 family protein [Clostridia bacterium]|nr:NlpC/P60 family protein [Clostridia bacterium]
MSKTQDFLAWLRQQQGAAYVWGAQGQEVCTDGMLRLDGKALAPSWEAWVDARETSESNAARAKAFIKRKLDEGDASVPLFDCSGLVMRYLQNIAGYFSSDKNAAALLAACAELTRDALFPGCFLFRHNGKKAHHVGVYLGDGQAVEAAGRDAGVVIRDIDTAGRSYWNRFGMLTCLEETERHAHARFARCAGGSVNMRSGPGTQNGVLCVVHEGDPLLTLSCETPGWKQVALRSGEGLVTGYMYAKYIDIIEGGNTL